MEEDKTVDFLKGIFGIEKENPFAKIAREAHELAEKIQKNIADTVNK